MHCDIGAIRTAKVYMVHNSYREAYLVRLSLISSDFKILISNRRELLGRLPHAAGHSPLATILLARFGPCAAVAGLKTFVCRFYCEYVVRPPQAVRFYMAQFSTKAG